MTESNPKGPKSAPLERYTQILEAIAGSHNGLSSRDMEDLLGLPKTTVHRLLNALESSGLIMPGGSNGGRGGVFVIGDRLRRILASDTADIGVRYLVDHIVF